MLQHIDNSSISRFHVTLFKRPVTVFLEFIELRTRPRGIPLASVLPLQQPTIILSVRIILVEGSLVVKAPRRVAIKFYIFPQARMILTLRMIVGCWRGSTEARGIPRGLVRSSINKEPSTRM